MKKPPTVHAIQELAHRANVEERIWAHYAHAKEKHPYFCDRLLPDAVPGYFQEQLEVDREMLKAQNEKGRVTAMNLCQCELSEAYEAIANCDTAAAVEELYDCVAVILRTIDVLEGRQELGKQKEGVRGQ